MTRLIGEFVGTQIKREREAIKQLHEKPGARIIIIHTRKSFAGIRKTFENN